MKKNPSKKSYQKEVVIKNNIERPFLGNLYNSVETRGLVLLYTLVIIISLVVFKDFIFLKKLYLFTDIGSDTINTYWPTYALISDYFSIGEFPGWSFQTGMGQNIFPQNFGDPFRYFYYLSDRENIPYIIFYVELLKIFIATGLFYAFLKIIRLNTVSSVLGALLYGFSGYMIVGSGWYIFSTEVVYVAMLLYSFERFYQKGSWLLFAICIALVAASGPFYLYLQGLFIFVYSLVRHYNKSSINIKQLLLMEVKLMMIGIIGLGISAVFFMPAVDLYLQSPRVGGESGFFASLSSVSKFAISDATELWTALSRTFSPDLLGNGSNFKGWNNYLEAPVFYCGTLGLLLFPQIFLNVDYKRKITYGLLLAVLILVIILPYFRYLFWLFSGDYYRTFSLYVTLILIFFSVRSLNYLITHQKLNIWLLLITSVLLISFLHMIPENVNQTTVVDLKLRSTINTIIIFSTGILMLVYFSKTRYLGTLLLLMIVSVEIIYMTSNSVNNRQVLTPKKMEAKLGYNDFTIEALEQLKNRDKSFYRINKDYYSNYTVHTSLNDAKYQRYFGTPSYASFNQKYYIEFLNAFNVIDAKNETETRWAKGLMHRPLLQTFASVKYNLITSVSPGYLGFNNTQIGTAGNVKISQSKSSIPLGFTYETFIKRSLFDQLSTLQMDLSVFKAFIVDDDSYTEYNGFNEFQLTDTTTDLSIVNLIQKIDLLKQDTLSISSFSQNRIDGAIDPKSEKLLFLSIPYDRGWKAFLDDKEADIHIVNVGFMGIKIPKGKHEVVLKYFPPYVKTGAIISVFMFLLAALLFVFKRKIVLLNPNS